MADDKALLDLLDRILGRNLGWIATADSKVAPILAVDTAMLGVLAALVPRPSGWTFLQVAATSLAVALLLASVVCLVLAVFPRTEGPRGSRVYFGSIAKMEREAYVTSILSGVTQELLQDFTRQCHRNAEIADAKFSYVRRAMLLVFFSIIPWLVAVALLYSA